MKKTMSFARDVLQKAVDSDEAGLACVMGHGVAMINQSRVFRFAVFARLVDGIVPC